jgi:hypothetical protein
VYNSIGYVWSKSQTVEATMGPLKPKRRWQPSELETRVGLAAQLTAEREAASVPWPRLQEAREAYLDWEAFILWIRAVEEAEGHFPESLAEVVDKRCRGFLKGAEDKKSEYSDGLPFIWRRLERWINDRIFSSAWREGWMNAVGYYAARDLTSLRNHAYWGYCEREWKRSKPVDYPSFHKWLRASEHCGDQVLDDCEMAEEKRRLIKIMRRVGIRTLRQAVERYLEWEAFAYWTRIALEAGSPLPASVESEVKRRCPGFLEADAVARAANPREEPHCRFNRMIKWIEDHKFAEAQKRGWFDAMRYQAHLHPRHARVIDYWHDWEAGWAKHPSAEYPFFKKWRDAADRYTFELEES